MAALSLDLRKRIIDLYSTGTHSMREIAVRFSVARETVRSLVDRWKATGSYASEKVGAPSLSIWTDIALHQALQMIVAEKNDATLQEYCDTVAEKYGVVLTVPQMCKLLQQLKLYRKKKTLRATEGECERVEQARIAWEEKIKDIDAEHLVFLDETGTNLGMVRRYARAEGQARARGHAPKNPGENISVIGTIRLDGEKTAMNFPGSLNGEAYEVYAEKILCLSLRAGDVVVMDNLRVHQNQKVRDMIEARGASIWYLPPYSPHLNPIEECWSKFKSILRTVAARTREALDDGITHALKQINTQDIRGWFEHSGYLTASG